MLALLGVSASPPAVARAQRFLLARMRELYAGGPPLRPGAADLLSALAAAGVPTALVSSSYRVLVDAALRGLAAAAPGHRFAVTVAGDEVTHGKPAPEPYLRAAAALGADPGRCVVLEDSAAGVAAGAAAGCVCVYVPDPATPQPDRALPAYRRASLAEVTPGWLASLVPAAGPR